MAKRFFILGAVADGEYYSESMSADFSRMQLSSILFYDANGAIVTPTDGIYAISGSPDSVNYLNISNSIGEITFNAADAYHADIDRPCALDLMVSAKLTLMGITGAEKFKVTIWRA